MKRTLALMGGLLVAVSLMAALPAEAQGPKQGKGQRVEKRGPGQGMRTPDQVLARMDQHLNLTAAQEAKIKPILSDMQLKMKSIRENTSLTPEQKRAQMQTIRTTAHDKIKAVLTPEQQAKFQQGMGPGKRGPGGPGKGPGGGKAKGPKPTS